MDIARGSDLHLHPCKFEVADKIRTDGQYAILSLAGSQNLCQTIIKILKTWINDLKLAMAVKFF